ncbi:MAG: hypothetical protein E6772_08485 [Dysgonomonas sp.]|nr:hypothetical protein [Dysgonomonas sp.]
MKKIFTLLLSVVILTSCASAFGIADLGSRVKKLELGMSKREALGILGNTYDVQVASRTGDGDLEILKFTSMTSYNYLVHFLDGRLVEWHKDIPPQPIHVVKEVSNAN